MTKPSARQTGKIVTQISTQNYTSMFDKFRTKMENDGANDHVIETFRHYYEQLLQGSTGYIPSSSANPVNNITRLEELENYSKEGEKHLDNLVILNLNGGLGTSMGMR